MTHKHPQNKPQNTQPSHKYSKINIQACKGKNVISHKNTQKYRNICEIKRDTNTLIPLRGNNVIACKCTKTYRKTEQNTDNILKIYQKYSKNLENRLLPHLLSFRRRGAAPNRRGVRLFECAPLQPKGAEWPWEAHASAMRRAPLRLPKQYSVLLKTRNTQHIPPITNFNPYKHNCTLVTSCFKSSKHQTNKIAL